jgi:hypothetical protein
MVKPIVGAGSQYMSAAKDVRGAWLDGGKSYRLRVPADVPVKEFWAVTVYDNMTLSMIDTDTQKASVDSHQALAKNSDGSTDVYFGPDAPAGREANWIKTLPGHATRRHPGRRSRQGPRRTDGEGCRGPCRDPTSSAGAQVRAVLIPGSITRRCRFPQEFARQRRIRSPAGHEMPRPQRHIGGDRGWRQVLDGRRDGTPPHPQSCSWQNVNT